MTNWIRCPPIPKMPVEYRISQLRHELMCLSGQYAAAARENDQHSMDALIEQGRLYQKELTELEKENGDAPRLQ